MVGGKFETDPPNAILHVGNKNMKKENIGIGDPYPNPILYSKEKVGIGTSPPTTKFTISGSSNADMNIGDPSAITIDGIVWFAVNENGPFPTDEYSLVAGVYVDENGVTIGGSWMENMQLSEYGSKTFYKGFKRMDEDKFRKITHWTIIKKPRNPND